MGSPYYIKKRKKMRNEYFYCIIRVKSKKAGEGSYHEIFQRG